ncbi:3-oxoadipate enol-lactonase [Nocardia asteroides]|uniref:3-oxoadipate enol-lactonase n=1 Tax=Nocardia asteroides TaxID=1824 RepID=UPI001E5918C1|nr:3-oxoadipate enol-lactonase [Nocardia asteroides]UGT61614.1 3-oxoadipate enol-lactonase [Nocardia asteroides]
MVDLAHTVVPGVGTPLVFLGSIASDRSMWQPQLDELGGPALAVDLRGHGGSPAPAGPYTVAELAMDVVALLDRTGIDAAHLVGLSLGGAVAQWIAAHRPERVSALSLFCTAARFGTPAMWAERAALVRRDGTASLAASALTRWFTPGFTAAHPEIAARCTAMISGTDDEAYAGCCAALGEWDGRADLARISAPTLVVAGADDPGTPPSVVAEVADGIAGAEFVVLDDAAHLPTLQHPRSVSALIARRYGNAGSTC